MGTNSTIPQALRDTVRSDLRVVTGGALSRCDVRRRETRHAMRVFHIARYESLNRIVWRGAVYGIAVRLFSILHSCTKCFDGCSDHDNKTHTN